MVDKPLFLFYIELNHPFDGYVICIGLLIGKTTIVSSLHY